MSAFKRVNPGVALALAANVALTGAALAHTGHAEHGFSDAFAHPFGGLDHLFAMAAVGWVAAARDTRSALAIPGAFVAAMALGCVLAWSNVPMTWAEPAIAVSLIGVAGILAFGARLPLPAVLALTAAAGLPHGLAHGAELAGPQGLMVIAGFSLATALLHALGYGLGVLVRSGLPARFEPAARAAASLPLVLVGALALLG